MEPQADIRERLEELKILAPAGFAMALHIRFTTPAYLFQTYPKVWIDHYSQAGLVMRDPTVMWGFENLGVALWEDLVPLDSHGVIAAAAKHGMTHGFTYALERAGSRSLCSFTRSDRPFSEAEILTIRAHIDAMHDETFALESLSPQTREALRLMSIIFTHP